MSDEATGTMTSDNKAIVPENAAEFAKWMESNRLIRTIAELHRCHKLLSDHGDMKSYNDYRIVQQCVEDLHTAAYDLNVLSREWMFARGGAG